MGRIPRRTPIVDVTPCSVRHSTGNAPRWKPCGTLVAATAVALHHRIGELRVSEASAAAQAAHGHRHRV